ncbi:radical SAM family heme chaperone HemW [Hoylesella timonensis]|uniref:radical SAM family heme chaperone HemW n=1 Tax=Hoylesella timonensis TaxID=386414 RepID=UPI00242B7F0E|nr:radical SAM family heme chaperone HemW [Hoylesella timonensis]
MAGLYLHIPFCASRCIYCGFYSTTNLSLRQKYVDALCQELRLRRDYLSDIETNLSEDTHLIRTIYIGGGTPSQLTPAQLQQIFEVIGSIYFNGNLSTMRSQCEVTLECNPDDISPSFVDFIEQSPINRISMGVQTFSNAQLNFLHRRHEAEDVVTAVNRLREIGVDNISIDLMFGFPNQSLAAWERDILQALDLGVEHISAYSLMYEEGTPLNQLLKSNKIHEIDDELSLQMYQTLVHHLKAAGYEHYEISNFAKPGKQSRHNSSYWHAIPYLGIGAAAHSYNIESRQWNVSDLKTYITAIEQGKIPAEKEWLDADTRYNDLVTTALRTSQGIRLSALTPRYRNFLLQQAKRFIDQHLMEIEGDYIRLTTEGIYISDAIMTDLIYA